MAHGEELGVVVVDRPECVGSGPSRAARAPARRRRSAGLQESCARQVQAGREQVELAGQVQGVRPGVIVPGHQARHGTRMPPSQVEPFPSRSRPAEPPCNFWISQGPLSLVKTTRVDSANPSSRSGRDLADAPVNLFYDVAKEPAWALAVESLAGVKGNMRRGVGDVKKERAGSLPWRDGSG